jgi:hypothetical protein
MFRAFDRPINVAVVLIAIATIAFAVASWRIGFWTEDGPGPGLLPFAAACLVFPILFLILREQPDESERFRRPPLLATLVLCGYAIVLPYLGFVIPTVALIAVWATIFEQQNILRGLLLGIFLVACGWVVFVYLLQIPMPLFPVL